MTMSAWISNIISKLVRFGRLEIEFADGRTAKFGDGTGPDVAVRFADKAALWDLVRDPELTFGELYMDGRMLVTRGNIYDLIAMGAANLWRKDGLFWIRLLEKLTRPLERSSKASGKSLATMNWPTKESSTRRRAQ